MHAFAKICVFKLLVFGLEHACLSTQNYAQIAVDIYKSYFPF